MKRRVSLRPGGRALAGFTTLWFLGLGMMYQRLLVYSTSPGPTSENAATWPAACEIPRPADRFVLVMFVHPRCSCTRASLIELEHILAGANDRPATYVLFYAPRRAAAGWEKTDLWDKAAALPGAKLLADEGGRLAKLFGARTSGVVLAYNPAGHLAFSGGITLMRGHSGDNPGRQAISSLLRGDPAVPDHTPVFGCLLDDSQLADPGES